jgi:hypothetical protein
VPDQYVTAIETALGHHLQLVLTEQPEAAHEILADLSANKKGRASVVPLAFLQNGHADQPPVDADGAVDQTAIKAPGLNRIEWRAIGGDFGGGKRAGGPAVAATVAGHDPDRAGFGQRHCRLA